MKKMLAMPMKKKCIEHQALRALVLIAFEQNKICGNNTKLDDPHVCGIEKKSRHERKCHKRTGNHTAVDAYERVAVVEFDHQIGRKSEQQEMKIQLICDETACQPYHN